MMNIKGIKRKSIMTFLIVMIGIIAYSPLTNAFRTYYYSITDNEKRIFEYDKNLNDKVIQLFKTKLYVTCYDKLDQQTDNINFECKENWEGKEDGKAGCGFVRNTEEYFRGYCDLGKVGEDGNTMLYRLKIKLKSKKPEIEYKTDLDISDKFLKKSIQKKELSCESSATSDIISTIKNKKYTEDDIIKYLPKSGFNTTEWKDKNGIRHWGNPDEGFVGYLDKYQGKGALQRKYEGYGVYEKPITKVYDQYGIKTKILNKFNRKGEGYNNSRAQLVRLLKEINKGNLVQLWGDTCTYPQYEDGKIYSGHITQEQADKGLNGRNKCLDPYTYRSRTLTWIYDNPETGEKTTIKGLNGEQAFYLLGYKGNVTNPTHIIVWDTNTGKHTYPTNERLRKWDKMDNRSIIVYTK